jgi:hypothetical protein
MLVPGSIAPVVPPTLTAVTRAAVMRFREELYQYLQQLRKFTTAPVGVDHFSTPVLGQ